MTILSFFVSILTLHLIVRGPFIVTVENAKHRGNVNLKIISIENMQFFSVLYFNS